MKEIKLIPWVLILLVVWSIIRFAKVDLNQVISLGLFLLALVIMVFEFFKSGDINLKAFGIDQLYSIIAIAFFCTIETILILKNYPFQIVDILFGILVLADGWVSPVNSFRTALRNFEVGNGNNGVG